MSRRLSDFPAQSTALAISPAQERSMPDNQNLQHLRFHTGRSLDAADLRLEAENAEARFGLMARVLVDGVIDGLQVAMADQASAPGAFDLAPGYAIGPQGQDLTLNRHVRLTVSELPRGFATRPEVTPPVGGICVLIAEPISGEETRFASAQDKSAAFRRDQQLDNAAAPYQDARVIDGMRLSLLRLDELSVGPQAPAAINTAIAELTEAERLNLPMAQFRRRAVALCLMGIASGGRILWLHRHGAARKGGGLPQVLPQSQIGLRRTPRLTQARVDALLETLSHLRRAPDGFDKAELTNLPPAGVLPRIQSAADLPFPSTWAIDLTPVPMGQLDALLAQSEALAGYDLTDTQDEVRIFVPVPDALFRRDLLEGTQISAAFVNARNDFGQKLSDRLRYREEVLKDGSTALRLVDSEEQADLLASYRPDPNALPGEGDLPQGADPTVRDYNTEAMGLFSAWRGNLPGTLITDAQRALFEINPEEDAPTAPQGLRIFVKGLQNGIDKADDFIDFGYTKVQAEIYRLRQIMLDTEEATKLATFPTLAGLAKGSNALAFNKGLRENFELFKAGPGLLDGQAEVARVETQDPVVAGSMLFPIEANSSVTPLVLSGLQGTGGLQGSSALSGPASGQVTVGTSGGFGLKITGVSLTQQQTQLSADAKVAEFSAPTVLTPGKTTDDNPFVSIFKASRDVVFDEIALADAADKRAGITLASAIPGDYRDLRTVTIADRLAVSAAAQARTAALRTKADTLSEIAELDVSMLGVKAPIMGLDAPVAILTRSDFDAVAARFKTSGNPTTLPPVDAALALMSQNEKVLVQGASNPEDILAIDLSPFAEAQSDVQKLLRVLRLQHTPVLVPDMVNIVLGRELDNDPAPGADEAVLLGSAIEILESTVSVFRAAERRVAALRGVLKTAVVLLESVEGLVDAWRSDLDAADVALSEARHDLQAMRALYEEEEARIDALEAEREDILANHVKFMAYARPRRLRPHSAGLTSGRLLPGVFDDPLPLALERPAKLPDDLAQMIEILRDVPIGWFAAREALLAGFGTPKVLDRTYHWAANAAAIRLNTRKTLSIAGQLGGAVPLQVTRGGKAARARGTARKISKFYSDLSSRLLLARQQIDLGRIDRQDWRDKRASAMKDLSLADLIEGAASATSAARALREVEQIERVIATLYVLLRRVPAAVRLLWADKLSVFDGDPVLADIARLPGWTALTPEARFDLRRLHSWLFGRVQQDNKEAIALMSDVMQVALLLAANADSEAVIKARHEAETTADPGDVIDLALDLGQPNIGTPVWFGAAGSKRVRAQVTNLLKGRVQVQIDRSHKTRVTLRPDMPIFIDVKRLSTAGYGR